MGSLRPDVLFEISIVDCPKARNLFKFDLVPKFFDDSVYLVVDNLDKCECFFAMSKVMR